ncbi:SAM-dependent methyltransferase [Rhodopila sp.]|jgi:SAM-dependent methyltransferase|uniref:SAM-dependent methyltransferase n=1 Tax=Rhodopila sp. TaxID=2480087 RepID=UPI002BE4B853|nr:SAM-dependent methyltransferase [Rhodopila sp.]HVZ10157.1 SAM-dependent methyltransferase [Rhodopila sp.]
MSGSRQPEHFEHLYRADPDPWAYRSSAYERRKYRHTIDALGGRRFVHGLEVGCSIGELTRLLADWCESLLGIDVVDAALAEAAARCAGRPHVRFARMQVPIAWPAGEYDLIVLSEVLYFLCAEDIDRLARHVRHGIVAGGLVLLVNWLGDGGDPLSGDAAAERFMRAVSDDLCPRRRERRPEYRLDLLERPWPEAIRSAGIARGR